MLKFTNQSPPYRWFKLYGQTETTCINLNSSSPVTRGGLRNGDCLHCTRCVYQVVYLHSDHSFVSKSDQRPVIIVKIDFSSTKMLRSPALINISLNVSVGHGVVSPPPPATNRAADGILGDSTNSNSVQVTDFGTELTVDGI